MDTISLFDATVLGVVEGLTEFLPVSSTGHLILVSRWLGLDLDDRGIQAFQIVIQSGALLAVFGIYWKYILRMLRGLAGRDKEGLRLVGLLLTGFAPAAVIGLLANDWIKAVLFGEWPVIFALAVGGVAMILADRFHRRRWHDRDGDAQQGLELLDMTWKFALIIGFAQCLAMWPGTSRSMVTMVAAMLIGFSPKAAAEFSFLLALPTLGGATVHDLVSDGEAILHASGWLGLAVGFLFSFIVAWVAVKSFLAWLTRHGLAPFGWYRIALAGLVLIVLLGFGSAG